MSVQVSIVMSVFDGEAYLGEAIESMLHQAFTDFEFIIVDDGSTDMSAEIVQTYAKQDSRIRLIKLNENMGLASALNHGMKQATGQYIARMDSDDICQSSRLQQQVYYLEAHPEVGVLGSRMQVVDKDKKPLFAFDVPQQHSMIVWNLFFGRAFAHPSVMMRRDLLVQVGGYDETISTAQDVDLWSRLVGQGRFANLPEQLLLYRTHQKATSIQKAQQQNAVLHTTLKRLLMQLWGDDDTDDIVARFLKIRSGKPQFTQDEYEQVKIDMRRLAESTLNNEWILPDEKPLIDADMKRLFDLAKPHNNFWDRWFSKLKL
jgi:GT2 family glycosyltransferase